LVSGSRGQGTKELHAVHVVFEGLAAVDEDDRNLLVVELAKVGVGVDVDYAPVEGCLGLQLREGVFDDVAEVTSGAGVDDHFMHEAIVARGWSAGAFDTLTPLMTMKPS